MNLIKRNLLSDIKDHLESKEISMIVGPRQVGKTTLMEELRKDLDAKGSRTLWLNLDYEKDKPFFESQGGLLRKIDLEFGRNKGFVFIDEIQRKENAGLFLKGLYDMNLPHKFIVSGSGSLELKEKIHESLTGRKRIFELDPVGFDEFADYKTDYKYGDQLAEFFSIHEAQTLDWLVEYLNFGGYPRIITEPMLAEKNKLMNEIYRSYLEKDIAYLLKIERIDAFSQLIKLLANQTGRILNYSEIAKQIGISLPTLKHYLWYAEKTYIIRMITPYFSNKGKEIIKSPVPYFFDIGLRNFSLNLFGNLQQPNQLGFVFQNFVANCLTKKIRFSGQSLHFWRTTDQAEVDFVLNRGSDIVPIEVKYAALKKPEMTRSFRNFLEKYKPTEGMIVNLTLDLEIKIDGTRVKLLPFHQLFRQS